MSEAEVLVVAVVTVGVLALGSMALALAVAVILVRRLTRAVADQLVLPIRAVFSADPDERRVAALRRAIRRSLVATEQAQAYARAAGTSGEPLSLARRVCAALRAADRDLAAAQRDPDLRVRRELAAASATQAERLLAASARLRAVLAGTAAAGVSGEITDLERDVHVEERVASEWAVVHARLTTGSASS